ncbi:hypothetical protein BH11MYX4_BH11MYX4_06500 [soil metagenome]
MAKQKAPKKVAVKKRVGVAPIGSRLHARLEKRGRLVLIHAKKTKFCEYVIEKKDMQFTVREGEVGSPGRATKTLRLTKGDIRSYAMLGLPEALAKARKLAVWVSWAVDDARARITKGYDPEDVAIAPDLLARWREHVEEMKPLKKGWQGKSEEPFIVWG